MTDFIVRKRGEYNVVSTLNSYHKLRTLGTGSTTESADRSLVRSRSRTTIRSPFCYRSFKTF
jgi:hypothetical protein